MSAEREHALLSASGSHRWLHCTPSARLEEKLPDNTNEYAAEGHLAHQIAELKLRKAFVEPIGPRKFNSELKKLQENPLYQDEMQRHTDGYLDYISAIVHGYSARPYITVEKRLDYSAYAPEGFGTGDCIIIGGCTLHVIDFKYGKGVPVIADGNPQMMLYALGAIREYSLMFAVEQVKMVIFQPRLDSVSEFEISAADLLTWGDSIKLIAEKAFKGEGDYCPGEYCRFCRAKALCRARSEFNLGLQEYHMLKPPFISNEEIGEVLRKAQDLVAWANCLEEYALKECLAGNDIPGWKAVEGRSTRKFTDLDAAFGVLTSSGYDQALLYTREPITLAEVEKLIGAAKFKELLSDHVIKPPGKPALAPTTDKREAITRLTAAQEFNDGGNEQ